MTPTRTETDETGTDETGPNETGTNETGTNETGIDETLTPLAVGSAQIVLIDDHPLLAAALQDRLQAEDLTVAVVDPQDWNTVVRSVAACRPELVVLDLGLPVDGGGLGLIAPLTSTGAKVAVLTGEADHVLWARCSAAGAEVILSKAEPLEDITWSIGQLLNGQPVKPHQRTELAQLHRAVQRERAERRAGFDQLSERERQVLAGLMAGQGASQLAERDVVSIQTIRSHIKRVLSKLGVNSQLAAVARANACGWESDQPDWSN